MKLTINTAWPAFMNFAEFRCNASLKLIFNTDRERENEWCLPARWHYRRGAAGQPVATPGLQMTKFTAHPWQLMHSMLAYHHVVTASYSVI